MADPLPNPPPQCSTGLEDGTHPPWPGTSSKPTPCNNNPLSHTPLLPCQTSTRVSRPISVVMITVAATHSREPRALNNLANGIVNLLSAPVSIVKGVVARGSGNRDPKRQ